MGGATAASAATGADCTTGRGARRSGASHALPRSEEHTSELQSRVDLVCRLLLEKKNRIERLGERPPEVAQHLLPREIAFLHLVELIFHQRRESHLEHIVERALHYLPHRFPERRG